MSLLELLIAAKNGVAREITSYIGRQARCLKKASEREIQYQIGAKASLFMMTQVILTMKQVVSSCMLF